jgi:biopolymer transport protein ExbB
MDSTYGIAASVSSWYGLILMSIIGAMSVYLVALAFVRLQFFRKIRVDSAKLLDDLQKALASNDETALTTLKGQRASDAPTRILVSAGVANRHLPEPDLRELLQIAMTRQRERLVKGISAFGVMSKIAPFLGLLATVLGIIESFHGLATSGAAGSSVVASGVAAALWGTAAGLVVAIPSEVAYHIFTRKARSVALEMDTFIREILLVFRVDRPKRTPKAA